MNCQQKEYNASRVCCDEAYEDCYRARAACGDGITLDGNGVPCRLNADETGCMVTTGACEYLPPSEMWYPTQCNATCNMVYKDFYTSCRNVYPYNQDLTDSQVVAVTMDYCMQSNRYPGMNRLPGLHWQSGDPRQTGTYQIDANGNYIQVDGSIGGIFDGSSASAPTSMLIEQKDTDLDVRDILSQVIQGDFNNLGTQVYLTKSSSTYEYTDRSAFYFAYLLVIPGRAPEIKLITITSTCIDRTSLESCQRTPTYLPSIESVVVDTFNISFATTGPQLFASMGAASMGALISGGGGGSGGGDDVTSPPPGSPIARSPALIDINDYCPGRSFNIAESDFSGSYKSLGHNNYGSDESFDCCQNLYNEVQRNPGFRERLSEDHPQEDIRLGDYLTGCMEAKNIPSSSINVNTICDFSFEDNYFDAAMYNMGRGLLNEDGSRQDDDNANDRCCRSVENIYHYYPDVISGLNSEESTNLSNYVRGCVVGDRTKDNPIGNTMDVLNTLACSHLECQNGGTLNISHQEDGTMTCGCECPEDYTGETCDKTCERNLETVNEIMTGYIHPGLTDEQEKFVNKYYQDCS